MSQAAGCLLLLGSATACNPGAGPAANDADTDRSIRVVVIAPAAAEMMDALGVAGAVVGLGQFGPWPPSMAGLPVVGGYDAPNVERVLELSADMLVSTASRAAVPAHRRLEELGVQVIAVDTSTFDGVFAAIDTVGRTFGRQAEARELEQRLRGELDEIATRAAGLPRRRVLFVVGRDPLYVAGPGSHLDQLISLVGGVNVAGDANSPYQQLSMEAALERLPEVIIDTSDNRPGAPRGRETGPWERWPFLPAVHDRRVYQVDPSRLVIPGIRLPEMAQLIGQLVQPETFGEADAASFGPVETVADARP